MRVSWLVLFALLGACTQHNPAVCCNTPSQCLDLGLDQMYGCDTGKVCNAKGACVQATCASSVECTNAEEPFCAGNGLCDANCVDDMQCPGGGQDANLTHCVQGTCAECVAAADCSMATPVCDSGACRKCVANAECASEICGSDGACVAPDLIAYASSAGIATGNCEMSAPCTLARAVSLGRPYTAVSAGTYSQTTTLALEGTSSVVGTGGAHSTVTRSTPGPIVTVGVNAHVHLENLQISGATNTSTTVIDGDGILCPNNTASRSLDLVDVSVTANAAYGVNGKFCTFTASRSGFTNNGKDGVFIVNNPMTADRCTFAQNAEMGLDFDGTILKLTNSFVTMNAAEGIGSVGFGAGSYVQFCTISGNHNNGARLGHSDPIDVSNNLLAGNMPADLNCNAQCVTSGNIALGTDITSAHFTAFGDFHITAGSVAIDAATTSTMDHDFDGDVRPKGAGRDVGADEAQ